MGAPLPPLPKNNIGSCRCYQFWSGRAEGSGICSRTGGGWKSFWWTTELGLSFFFFLFPFFWGGGGGETKLIVIFFVRFGKGVFFKLFFISIFYNEGRSRLVVVGKSGMIQSWPFSALFSISFFLTKKQQPCQCSVVAVVCIPISSLPVESS